MISNEELAALIQQKVRDQLGSLIVELLAKDAQIQLLQKELAELKPAAEVTPHVEGNSKLPRPKAV